MASGTSVHDEVGLRLAGAGQRYTAQRRLLTGVLASAARPLTINEILASAPGLTQSTVYRNITELVEAGVVERIAGTGDRSRFELAAVFSGHHHHLVCEACGTVEDLRVSPALERALREAARAAADQQGYEVTDHRLDFYGRCEAC
jgi:Fe2+ or Zn2+ uptake regulation protein